MMVRTPAAAKSPSSYPEVLAVLVIVAAIGLASTAVSVLAKSNSTQENIKQKKAVIPMPALILGIKILKKNFGKEYPSTYAVSSNSFGTPDIKPSIIQTANGMLNKQCANATAKCVSKRPKEE